MRLFSEMKVPDLERHRGKLLRIIAVRISFFLAILAITIIYQLRQATFFNTESLFPLYILLIIAFVLNALYLYYFDKTQRLWQPTAFLFGFDTIFVTALILITGAQQSIFLFLYLVNIILCGFVFQRKGALIASLFTSACFSLILILGPELQGQTLYYAVGLNNLAFFSVAGLSGYLSEQLNFIGTELNIKKRDIQALQDINKIIVENISSGLITVAPDGHVLLSNKSGLRILGVSDILGRDIDEVIPGIRQVINSKDARLERRHTLPNGERVILGMTISPLTNEEKVVSGYIIIFQDLTEIVRLESAMRRQEKLAAVGKLAAGIAHEIRNPLASISGSIELLRTLLHLTTPEQNKLMEIMLKEIDRLNSLITEFLEFVRPGEKKLDVCQVDPILNEVMDMMKVNTNLPQHVKQVRRLGARSAIVSGDKNKLKQVFLNLAINAYQAMAETREAVLTVETNVKEEKLYVHFRDTGHGMSEQTQKRLFEPFFTTKAKGTGLGLATVHKILEIHEAEIFVESHEDKGTEFTIRFNELITEANRGGANRYEGQNTGS